MRGEVAPRFFLMSGKARQKEKEERGRRGKRQVEERKGKKKRKVYTSSPKRATVAIPRVARLKRERRRGKKGKREREREMDGYIQALNGSEKSAKSVGIYSTNASASFHHFLLPLPFYSLHPRNIRGNQQRGHYRNSNFVCTRSLEERSRTQSGHLSKGGGGEGKKKGGGKWMKPLFSLPKRGPWARPGKFFHGITEMKRDLRFGISFNRGWNTHVCSSCFHWEILFFFSFAKHPHYE